jgi:hypothetical protein
MRLQEEVEFFDFALFRPCFNDLSAIFRPDAFDLA